jgi:septal ring factor EnvC (AmiA/AmiB activator)
MTDILGIPGLTLGAAGIWLALITYVGRVAIRWIMGMPDRRRAEIAGHESQEDAIDAQWKRFQGEIDRLLKRVEQLEGRVKQLEGENNTIREERDTAVSELIKLRAVNAGQGQTRQEAAVLVSAERIVEQKRAKG